MRELGGIWGNMQPSNIRMFPEGFLVLFNRFVNWWDRNRDEMVFCCFCHGCIFLVQILEILINQVEPLHCKTHLVSFSFIFLVFLFSFYLSFK
jgi:hypothetical protein